MNSNKGFLVFPHQLFESNFRRSKNFIFYLIEEPLFFQQYNFHKQKLIFHRASMKYYEKRLSSLGFKVVYLEASQITSKNFIYHHLVKDGIEEIQFYEVTDDWLNLKIRNEIGRSLKLVELPTPMFLNNIDLLKEEFSGEEHYSMSKFYIKQRKKLNLLIQDGKPLGGKWSLDIENRKKLPSKIIPPLVITIPSNQFVLDAQKYIHLHYPTTQGATVNFNYAVTHKDARSCLKDFIENRLELFGTYEDAISSQHIHLYHSVISPYLNSGLLTPEDILVEIIEYSEINKVPLNSLEGFIRQLIGWREFMRAVYVLKGRRERSKNFWGHSRKLSESFYNGTTGIAPVDMVIKRVLNNAYSHHIERLMVMGNFMLLCEIDPDNVYQWFMELYIDAYDWVMVPNVYSMSQYAGGGVATTKPYISGSNYILKMSNYKKDDWCTVWDRLYWRFIDRHKNFFKHNPRLVAMTYHLDKISKTTLNKHHKEAEEFLKKITI